MACRLSRIRFIVVRSCVISFIVILCLQFMESFSNDNSRENSPTVVATSEELFWRKLSNEDKDLTEEQRIKAIESSDRQTIKRELNWTKIFLDNYARKLLKINERDAQTIYKKRIEKYAKTTSQEKYDIFEETLVFGRPKFCAVTNIFHPQCPYSNCRWTCDKSSTNQDGFRRAYIFHHIDIKHDEIIDKVANRSSDDIWILWIDEANRQISHLNQYQFNWTLSFRQDSEVSLGTYGILIEKDQNKVSPDNVLPHNSELVQILTKHNVFIDDVTLENRIFLNYRYRYKHALWFVSNCQPQHRLNYYKELKLHYPISAFGLCVDKRCDKNHDCEYKQSHLGLFYLAFESQTCKDYITEKFWRALYYGMIPIVLGPSKQSYLDLGIPESAFIHVDDYQSIGELASHLHQVSNDYMIYRKYFQWLNQYEVFYDINVLEPIRMCELCMRLNMQESRDHSFYSDVHEWHRNGCQT
ncbi:unnamed protein product [Rotaria magnacalcarata]|uniref:Fucosyltransferase n=3 Tax=Rotaria magnacalcarata TaxID=392030 RepID=A0A815PJ97_9BILA|nr:unnamed protein product [Rotaria magnacalcarata]CAF1634367.1 unnamed protein product [Rotaria magnacalcarata]CAF2070324.1 unnamed protein product [Rotaria magnacalcarata]CAF2073992.1 unnamed protein product [Rotaria magnacalcarata]CAF2139806.1 unnamed protein product [Rotaria magnacalcarata]